MGAQRPIDRYRAELRDLAGVIEPGPLSLLSHLASGGKKGAGWLDYTKLTTRGGPADYAAGLGRSERAVKYWLRYLVEIGLLVMTFKGGSYRGGRRLASTYKAVTPSKWLEGTAGQTHANDDLHGSDQGISDRPMQRLPQTHATVAHPPKEVRNAPVGAAPQGSPPSRAKDTDAADPEDIDTQEALEEEDGAASVDAIRQRIDAICQRLSDRDEALGIPEDADGLCSVIAFEKHVEFPGAADESEYVLAVCDAIAEFLDGDQTGDPPQPLKRVLRLQHGYLNPDPAA